MVSGFYIRKVIAKGNNKEASLEFKKGANLITGASDTGKSYIFSLINYLLGRSTKPKEIPEAMGYQDLYLEIATFDDVIYTIERELGKDRVIVKQSTYADFTSTSERVGVFRTSGSAKNERNLSEFLLELSNLSGKRLLKNRSNNESISLTFKNINDLTSIHEQKIITEGSPFYPSGQLFQVTVEQSVLKVLLTGEDFSIVEPIEDPVKRETSLKGKLEYISNSILDLSTKREELSKKIVANNSIFVDINEISRLETTLNENISASRRIIDKKNELTLTKETYLEKIQYDTELIERFKILNKQYNADRQRLQFVMEAENLTSQLGDDICPVCASSLDSNSISHLREIEGFKAAITEEYLRIDRKTTDLNTGVLNLMKSRDAMMANVSRVDSEIEEIVSDLNNNLNPLIKDLQIRLSEYIDFERLNNELLFIDKQIQDLFTSKSYFENLLTKPAVKDNTIVIEYDYLLELTKFINARLVNWKYLPNVNVVFDSSTRVFDIAISGKSRRSFGKGKRAISYTACILGVLDYCLEKKMPFSNLIVIDSPLTTFEDKKGKEEDGMVEGDILDAFFEDLANTTSNCQVIIFDNKRPKSDLEGIHTVLFTGNDSVGRKGFFN